ncbi:MAG: twin-arginine translocase TatA/TatE family subunit [Candidatus Omnitrophota bacterium]
MPTIGFWELVLILLIVLLVFGAAKLPEIGRALGKAIREFKKATDGSPEERRATDGSKKKDEPPKG